MQGFTIPSQHSARKLKAIAILADPVYKTPAVALRAAQMKLWENPKWRNHYYWAGFSVQGERR